MELPVRRKTTEWIHGCSEEGDVGDTVVVCSKGNM